MLVILHWLSSYLTQTVLVTLVSGLTESSDSHHELSPWPGVSSEAVNSQSQSSGPSPGPIKALSGRWAWLQSELSLSWITDESERNARGVSLMSVPQSVQLTLITLSQSGASIQVTWSLLANQRPVSRSVNPDYSPAYPTLALFTRGGLMSSQVIINTRGAC